jgi:hypothetical protein
MRYLNFVDLFTICTMLTAVAGRCSQLAAYMCHRCPYPASDSPSRTHNPMLHFLFTNDNIISREHADSLDLLAAEVVLDILMYIRQAHYREAAEVFI